MIMMNQNGYGSSSIYGGAFDGRHTIQNNCRSSSCGEAKIGGFEKFIIQLIETMNHVGSCNSFGCWMVSHPVFYQKKN